MNILKSIWNWVVYSSANPQKLSLTLKAIIPFLALFGVAETDIFDGAIESIVHFVSLTGAWITGAMATYGALRKIFFFFYPKKIS